LTFDQLVKVSAQLGRFVFGQTDLGKMGDISATNNHNDKLKKGTHRRQPKEHVDKSLRRSDHF
jgi:hypothetical protein